jgi:hypothetical protein
MQDDERSEWECDLLCDSLSFGRLTRPYVVI